LSNQYLVWSGSLIFSPFSYEISHYPEISTIISMKVDSVTDIVLDNSSNHGENSPFGPSVKVWQFLNIIIEEKCGSLEISHEKSETLYTISWLKIKINSFRWISIVKPRDFFLLLKNESISDLTKNQSRIKKNVFFIKLILFNFFFFLERLPFILLVRISISILLNF
jgi:hypothetical protein